MKLDVRLSETERDEITAAAEASGITRAEYICNVLRSAIQGDHAWRVVKAPKGRIEGRERQIDAAHAFQRCVRL